MNEPEQALRACLQDFREPATGRTLAELQAIRMLAVTPAAVRVHLCLPIPVAGYEAVLQPALQEALGRVGSALALELTLEAQIGVHAVQRPLKPLPGLANLIAVGSAKGGVGKSTVAVNLALAWARMGARVGLLDADVYGPSQPLLLGVEGIKPETRGQRIIPVQVQGLKLMSLGLLIDAGQQAIWRGPMVTQALTQLLTGTEWGELDYLVLDLPPGTGDLQLTLAQKVPVAGAVIVTTPQQMAVADARKGLVMFAKVGIETLGVVENMATHVCTQCGHEEAIFGHGGGEALAAEGEVPFLGRLPLDARIRAESDAGRPTVASAPDSPRARAYLDFARRTAGVLANRPRDRSGAFPGVIVERKQ
jgi:ATP-binding protein involved in chromosome partitioning